MMREIQVKKYNSFRCNKDKMRGDPFSENRASLCRMVAGTNWTIAQIASIATHIKYHSTTSLIFALSQHNCQLDKLAYFWGSDMILDFHSQEKKWMEWCDILPTLAFMNFQANFRNLLELQQILSLNDFNIKSGCSYIFLQKFIP